MNGLPRVHGLQQAALLIDADNFADPYAIDTAWKEFQAYAGRISVCNAYGAAPRLQSLWSVWRYLGTRTFPNLSLEKNTTDAALIVDAVALHFQQGIRLFAIASGDADFAPLAARLREWGCEVWCFSIENIVFRDAETYYDRVKCFPAPVFAPAPAPLRPVMPSAWGGSVDMGAGGGSGSGVGVGAGAGASASFVSAVRPAYRPPAAPPQAPLVSDADLPDEVVRILNIVPGLRQRPQHLCHVVPVLERHGLFDKRVTRSTEFLRQYADYFELSPSFKPTLLTFRPLPAAAGAPGEGGEANMNREANETHEAHEVHEAHDVNGVNEANVAHEAHEADEVPQAHQAHDAYAANEIGEVHEAHEAYQTPEAYKAREAHEVNAVNETGGVHEAHEAREVNEAHETHQAHQAHETHATDAAREVNEPHDADAETDRLMPAPSPEDESALQRILAKSVSWQPDTIRQLNAFTILLEENGVALGDKPLDELFSLYPDYFELLPAAGPATKVRLLKKPENPVPASSEAEA
jgi:hypothetical protein